MIHLHSSLHLAQTKVEIDFSILYTYNGTEVYLSKPVGEIKFIISKRDYELIGKGSVIYQVTNQMIVNLKKVEDEE